VGLTLEHSWHNASQVLVVDAVLAAVQLIDINYPCWSNNETWAEAELEGRWGMHFSNNSETLISSE
jgi:hypothetical protein